jgi:hypothetical protein
MYHHRKSINFCERFRGSGALFRGAATLIT